MLTFLRRLPQHFLVGLVQGYRLLIRPALRGSCRFEPSCSSYSLRALELHGAAVGSYMTVGRLLRCHPFCEGGHDPVSAQRPRLFRRLAAGPGTGVGEATSSNPPDKTFL